MTNRVGTLKKNINYISPTYLRPTKEMLENYENIWLPLRKKIQEKKKENKKIFLLYGDFDIIEIKNDYIFPDTKKNISNPKNNTKSKRVSEVKYYSRILTTIIYFSMDIYFSLLCASLLHLQFLLIEV